MGLEKIEKEQRKKKEANKKLMNGLATQKENKICADCLERRVNFANITHGVFLCKQCAEIHCNLVSKTRIKALDVEQMLKNGNKKVNEKYSVGPCPMPSDSSIMSDYIWAKYGMTVLKISNRVLEKQLVATEYNHMMNGLKEGGLILKKDPKGPKLPEDSIEKVIPVESRVDEKKLQTLYDMGFLDRSRNRQVLKKTSGAIDAAMEILLQESKPVEDKSPRKRSSSTANQQTNDMEKNLLNQLALVGFTDENLNRQALARSNGNIQGAIELLLKLKSQQQINPQVQQSQQRVQPQYQKPAQNQNTLIDFFESSPEQNQYSFNQQGQFQNNQHQQFNNNQQGYQRDDSQFMQNGYQQQNPFMQQQMQQQFYDHSQQFQRQDSQQQVDMQRMEALRLEAQRYEMQMTENQRLETAQRLEMHQRQESQRIELQRQEAQKLEIQRQEAQKLEMQRQEAQRQEIQRQEAQRIEMQRQEVQRLEMQKQEAQRLELQRQEAQRLEMQKQEAQRLEMQRQEAQRLEMQRQEAQRLEMQRQEAQRIEMQRQEQQRQQMTQSNFQPIQQTKQAEFNIFNNSNSTFKTGGNAKEDIMSLFSSPQPQKQQQVDQFGGMNGMNNSFFNNAPQNSPMNGMNNTMLNGGVNNAIKNTFSSNFNNIAGMNNMDSSFTVGMSNSTQPRPTMGMNGMMNNFGIANGKVNDPSSGVFGARPANPFNGETVAKNPFL